MQEAGKLVALRQMVAEGLDTPVLVFVSTKERAKQLHQELKFERIHCDYLSADQSQAARGAAVQSFRAGKTWMLIATDLMGRGMDFLGVNTVVNYDFPGTKTDYIHRWVALECFCFDPVALRLRQAVCRHVAGQPRAAILAAAAQPFGTFVSHSSPAALVWQRQHHLLGAHSSRAHAGSGAPVEQGARGPRSPFLQRTTRRGCRPLQSACEAPAARCQTGCSFSNAAQPAPPPRPSATERRLRSGSVRIESRLQSSPRCGGARASVG